MKMKNGGLKGRQGWSGPILQAKVKCLDVYSKCNVKPLKGFEHGIIWFVFVTENTDYWIENGMLKDESGSRSPV